MTKDEQRAMSNRIKARRKALNYTQEQFSELLGISSSSYTRIENAFQKPALDTVIKIAKNLNVSIDYIVLGESNGLKNETTDSEKIAALLDYADKSQVKHTIEVLNKLLKI